jgi:phage terminase large subunit-like protein
LWRPIGGQKINLVEVEEYILLLDAKFGLEFVAYDPWQAEHLAQTLEADSNKRRRNQRLFRRLPWMREIAPTAANLREQATLTIEAFQDHRIECYPCEPLRRDLRKLRVEERGNSFRLVSPRDEHGHGDTASAFCLALVIGHELAGKKSAMIGSLFDNANANPFEAFAQRQRAFREEMERLSQEPDDDGFSQAAREGRVTIL